MDQELIKRQMQVPVREIAYLRFILEGYDGLVFMRTVDASSGVVEFAWPPSQRRDAEALLAALAREVPMRDIDPVLP